MGLEHLRPIQLSDIEADFETLDEMRESFGAFARFDFGLLELIQGEEGHEI